MERVADVDINVLLAERARMIEETYPSVETIAAPLLSKPEPIVQPPAESQSETKYISKVAIPCRGYNKPFFPLDNETKQERIIRATKAFAICRTCTLIDPCLEKAKQRKEPCGIWGGQEIKNGKVITGKDKNGRKIPGFPKL